MWTANDPAGEREWHGVWFPGFLSSFFFIMFTFIYFHPLNDELDKHEEKVF